MSPLGCGRAARPTVAASFALAVLLVGGGLAAGADGGDGEPDAVRRQAERQNEEREARASAAQRADRQASRRRFADQTAAEALSTARHHLGRHVSSPPVEALGGRRAVELLHERAAVVETGGGRRAVVTATAPLAVRDAGAGLRPVDLALERRGAGFAPRRTASAVAIPRRASDGVELRDGAVTLRPDGAEQAAPGAIVGGAVLYANAHRDADFAVRPAPDGVEVYDVLRSELSPEVLRLSVEGRGDVRLRMPADRPKVVEILRDGRPVGQVNGVLATDADGVAVETKVSLADADTIQIDVPHRDADHRYPITVDPGVSDGYDWQNYADERGTTASPPAGWHWETNQPATYWGKFVGWNYLGWGLHIWKDWNLNRYDSYRQGEYAQWIYSSPGDSTVRSVRAQWDLDLVFGHPPMCVITGMQIGTAWSGSRVVECGDEVFDRWSTHTDGSGDNRFAFRLEASTTDTRRQFEAHLQYVTMELWDTRAPTVSFGPSGWGTSASGSVTGSDSGLGVKSVELSGAPTVTRSCQRAIGTMPTYDNQLCAGASLTTTANYPEGRTNVVAQATDVVDQTSGSVSGVFRVDSTAPLAPTFPALPSRPALGAGPHEIAIAAADDRTRAADVSGARRVDVTIDGGYSGDATGPSCTDNCTVAAKVKVDGNAPAPLVGEDGFTGSAAGTPLQNRTAPRGGRWLKWVDSTLDAVVTSGGDVRQVYGRGVNVTTLTDSAPSPDYDVSANVAVPAIDDSASDKLGVVGRMDAATGLFYSAAYERDELVLARRTIATNEILELGRWRHPNVTGTSPRVTLRMQGSQIMALADGVLRLRATDTRLAQAGRGGLFFDGRGARDDATTRRIDNFEIALIGGLTEGRHELSGVTTDGVALTSVPGVRSIIVDRTPPVLDPVTGTAKQRMLKSGTYGVRGSATDPGTWPDIAGIGRFDLVVDGVRRDTVPVSPAQKSVLDAPFTIDTSQAAYDAGRGYAEGLRRFEVRVYDDAKSFHAGQPAEGTDGNVPDTESFDVIVDRSKPRPTTFGGTLLAPGGVGHGTYTLDATVQDDHSGVETWSLSIDGAPPRVGHSGRNDCDATRPCPTAPQQKSFQVDTTGMLYGTHTATLTVKDPLGHDRVESRTFYVNTDKVPPTVEQQPIENVDGWRNASSPLAKTRVTGRDAGIGVKSLVLVRPSGVATRHDFPCAATGLGCLPQGSNDFTYSADAAWPEGRTTVRARAIDAAENVSPDTTWVYRVDRTGPSNVAVSGAFVTASGQPFRAPARLRVTASDGANTSDSTRRSGVKSAELLVDGAPAPPAMQGPQSFEQACPLDSCALDTELEFDPAPLTPGDHTVQVRVADHAGNATFSTAYAIRVAPRGALNTVPPEIVADNGTAVGAQVSTTNGTWSGLETDHRYEYQWRSCDANGAACEDIAGATSSSYRISPTLLGRRLRSTVLVVNRFGGMETRGDRATSAASPAVSADILPPVLLEPAHEPPLPPGWVDDHQANVTGTAADVGLGLHRMELTEPRVPADAMRFQRFKSVLLNTADDCTGTAERMCPPLGSKAFAYRTTEYREGRVTSSLVAVDAAENRSDARRWLLKVDRSAPEVDFGGAAGGYRGGAITQAGRYELLVEATDGVRGGTDEQQRSGVASIQLELSTDEGAFVDRGVTRNDTCVGDSCPASRPFVLDTAELGEGLHSVRTTVKDRLYDQVPEELKSRHVTTSEFRFYVDLEPPVLESVVHEPGLTSDWIGGRVLTVTATARDDGSGVRGYRLTLPGATGEIEREHKLDCELSTEPDRRCPQQGPATTKAMAYDTADLREGADLPAALRAEDAVSRRSEPSTWTLKIDRSAPDVVLGGTLPGIDGHQVEEGGEFDLTIAATDGDAASAATRRSGVRQVQVRVDGELHVDLLQACSQGDCPSTANAAFTLVADALSHGPHRVDIAVTDGVGHTTARDIEFTVTEGFTSGAYEYEVDGGTVEGDDGEPSGDFGDDPFDCTPDEEVGETCEDEGDITTSSSDVQAASEPSLSVAASDETAVSNSVFTAALAPSLATPGAEGWGMAYQVHGHADTTPMNELLRKPVGDPQPPAKHVRIVVPWDVALRPFKKTECGDRGDVNANYANLKEWVRKAPAVDRVLVSFGRCASQPYGRLPSVPEYREAIVRFMRNRNFRDIRWFSSWNEPNSDGQPTSFAKDGEDGPKHAAEFWNEFQRLCKLTEFKPCTVAAGEFVDGKDFTGAYLNDYLEHIKGWPSVWAFHPYFAGQRAKYGRLDYFLRRTRRTNGPDPKVWFTEQGGIKLSKTFTSETEDDAYFAGKRLIDEVVNRSDRITRFYYYALLGGATFDSGLVHYQDGTYRRMFEEYRARINP